MADIIGKIEGLAGLALLGGVAYAALKFGPGIVAAFRDAMPGWKQMGDAAAGVASGAGDVINIIQPPNPVDGLGDLYGAVTVPNPDPFEVYRAGTGMVWDFLGLVNPAFRVPGEVAKSFTDGVLGGAASRTDVEKDRAAKAAKEQQKSEYKASAVRFVSGSEASRNFDANLAKKRAEWQAAQDARTAAVKLLVQERNAALAKEREAQRIRNEQQYNAWLQSTRPASKSVADFLNAGKQYQGQREIAPGVYVAPSGAYQVIQDGQIVAGGSAGAVQAALDKANTAMYPGTNYRREVVEAYQAKARAGDAAAAAWLKRFAPAGAV